MITEQKKRDFKYKIKRQLDCSPKPTFEQRVYREYISRILSNHPKYTVISCQNKGDTTSFTIKNLLIPCVGFGTAGCGIKDRVLRWFKWYRKVTEGRELIINEDEWTTTYR